MIDNDFLEWQIYGLSRSSKRALLESRIFDLTNHHVQNCESYRRIMDAQGACLGTQLSLEEVPFIPVRLFKHLDLKSIPDAAIFKTLTSSGTTGQTPSRIFLDRETAAHQTIALIRIMQEFIGKARLPMLIIDHPGVIKDRSSFSARGAGILGLSNFGRDHVYALRDDMTLNTEAIHEFCEKHSGKEKLIFGFTFMVWQHFLRELESAKKTLPLGDAIFIHSGGWKKLQDIAVDNMTFKQRLGAVCGSQRIHNFYGMVEQVGSIFVECESGHLHAPSFSDVIIRDPLNWAVLPQGQTGVVQVLSCLPRSYPGHSLLTEDLGTVHGEDDCPCGRQGRHFSIHGRIPSAEVRGCSDTQPTSNH